MSLIVECFGTRFFEMVLFIYVFTVWGVDTLAKQNGDTSGESQWVLWMEQKCSRFVLELYSMIYCSFAFPGFCLRVCVSVCLSVSPPLSLCVRACLHSSKWRRLLLTWPLFLFQVKNCQSRNFSVAISHWLNAWSTKRHSLSIVALQCSYYCRCDRLYFIHLYTCLKKKERWFLCFNLRRLSVLRYDLF